MSATNELSGSRGRASQGAAGPRAGLTSAVAILLGSALLGVAGGFVWALVAPRALYVVTARGSADVVNPETSAFIAGDATYCVVGLAGGLIIGLAGYFLAVRRHGPWPMAAIVVGSVAAAVIARLLGEHQGLAAFDVQLLTRPAGTHLLAPLALAGDTAARPWPTVASLPMVASWPLAACLVAGGFTLVVFLRERSEPLVEPVLPRPPASPWTPSAWPQEPRESSGQPPS